MLNDIWFYFNPKYNKNKNITIQELYDIFLFLKVIYDDLDNKANDEIIIIFNYLINILYIYKDSGKIELSVFNSIIKSCLSFSKEVANETFKKIKKSFFLNTKFLINNIKVKDYNKEIEGEEIIKINGKNKKEIFIQVKYINWYLEDFANILDSENFMLLVRYPKNCDINYIKMEKLVSKGYENLFNDVINSKVVKQAMMFDDDARKYKYIYSNKDILDEVKNNTYFVCFPFENYFGYSDRKSFNIYIKSNYPFEEIKRTLASFDTLIRTQYHEYKHISRIYYHMVDDNIKLKTPKFDLSNFKNDRKYINDMYNESLAIVKNKTSNLSKNSNCFKTSFDEYGDLVEYAINGFKVEIQILRAVLFCLDNNSWKMEPSLFNQKLKYNMNLESSGFSIKNFVGGFGKVIYEYFDFFGKDDETLNCTFSSSRGAASEEVHNDVIELKVFSHHMNRGKNEL